MQRKKLFLACLAFFVLASLPFVGCVGASSVMWSRTYGGTGYETAQSVVETFDGEYVIAGGTTSFGAGGYDFWLIKVDAYGNKLWNWTYGGTKDDYAYCLIETSDRGFALIGHTGGTGSFLGEEYDVLLVKTDAYGNMEWNQTYGGEGYDIASSLVRTSDGGYALAGYTDSFGSGKYDFWLVKTDAYGNMEWNQTYGGEGYEEANSLIGTSDGGYILAGKRNSDWWVIKTDEYGVIPEFPSWTYALLALIMLAVAAALYKRKLSKKPSQQTY